MPIIIADPNDLVLNLDDNQIGSGRFKNFTPDYQNMVPYCEFFAVRKSVLVNFLENSSISTDSFERINLLGYDENPSGEKVFTARYLDADPTTTSSIKEAFGIKNIEIKTNASYVPVVNITFIDVKGQSFFAKNGKSSYGVLLDFPPPLFVLRVKGVYGLMVEYRLHLTSSNITFNANNSNYEIKCSFVGYNIAPLTDINVGLLTAVHFISPELSSNIEYKPNGSPRSFFELVLKGDVLYDKIDTYKNNSDDLQKLKSLDLNISKITDLKDSINYLSNVNNLVSSFNSPDNNNLKAVSIQNNQQDEYLDIQINYTHLETDELARISKLIEEYFKNYSTTLIDTYKDFKISTSDLKLTTISDQPITTTLQNFYIPVDKAEVNGNSLLLAPEDQQSIKYYKLEYKKLQEKILKKENEIQTKRKALLNKIQTNIGDLANIDVFQPTIKNIVEIITRDVDRFFKLMVDAALKEKKSVRGITGVLQFPEYNELKNVGGSTQLVKVYPGVVKDFQSWGEVEFVESIVGGLSRAQQTITRLDELQSIEGGDGRWTPIVPFETKTEGIIENEYFTQRINPGNIFENIHKRYCVAKNYTYKGYLESNELIDFIARAEARNLLYAVNNEEKILQYLNDFSTNYQDSDVNKFLAQIPGSSVYHKSDTQIFDLSVNNIKLNTKITPNQQNVINQAFSGLLIVDPQDVKPQTNIESENKVAELIDTVKDLTSPFLRKVTGLAPIEMSSDNILVFIDALKDSGTPTITTEYSNYKSDFFIDTLTDKVKRFITLKNKKNKEFTYSDLFDSIIRGFEFLDIYNNKDLPYKFFFPGLIEMPKIYLLFISYNIKFNSQINTDNTLNNVSKVFSNKLISSLTTVDQKFFTDYYDEFIDENPLFLDSEFYSKYSTNQDIDTLINSYIDADGVKLMDRTYILNSTPLTFSEFTPNNITIPKTFTFFNNSKTFTTSQLQFKTINVNDTQDKKYLTAFFNEIKKQIQNINKQKTDEKNSSTSSFGDDDIKGQLYYSLKNLYDRWLAVPDNIGQSKNLYTELFGGNLAQAFKYVDRTMSPTAENAIMDYRDLVEDSKDFSLNIYTVLTRFFSKNNFLFWPLQTSLIFDKKLDSNKWKSSFKLITENANELRSKPAFVCMFINSFSSNLNIDSKYYPDDGLSFLSPNDGLNKINGLPQDFNNTQSNVFVFIVAIGKQNQSIFGNIQLSTLEFNDTYESLKLTDLISKKNNDSNPISKGQNLYNVLSQRSYSVTVEVPLGNMCIQPTMYFELVGIPVFNGGYIITEVEHVFSADSNKLRTKFKGTRVGKVGLQMITDPVIKVVNILDLDITIS